ncbi:MAG: hypothetical protein HY599_05705 [Candidatus Omnitrophica bacterium]|nr:hypothetical protein [Candidatus Omnitrophota bacterium]
MRRVAFVLAMVLGAFIWAASPYVTGQVEPWDAETLYYPIALMSAGAMVALLEPRRFWLWPIAICVGQFAAIVVLMFVRPPVGVNFFFPIGMITLAIYMVPSLIGSAVGAGIGWVVRRLLASRK